MTEGVNVRANPSHVRFAKGTELACFVDSGWTFRPLKRPRSRE